MKKIRTFYKVSYWADFTRDVHTIAKRSIKPYVYDTGR